MTNSFLYAIITVNHSVLIQYPATAEISGKGESSLFFVKHKDKIKYVFIAFLLISFLGFVVETFYCFGIGKGFHDRGILILPFCPIYGISICLIYALFSVPDKIRFFSKPLFETPTARQKQKKYLTYFVFASLFPTLVELVTGFCLDRFLGIYLWDYFDYWFNFQGYICLEISISWGILITLFMKFVFGRILSFAYRVPSKIATVITVVFSVLLTADFLFNIIYIIVTGSNLVLY